MKIVTIIGARPQFIKAAAVTRAIAAHNARLTPDSLVRQVENECSEVRNVSGSETQITQVQCSEICQVERSNSHRLLGTIPEAKRSGTRITEVIIHTGQHYDDDMSAIFFRELEIPEPKYNLNIGSGAHGQQTGEMLAAIEKVLIEEKPDWVLVYGDTNSTLAGSLAAAKLHIRIAHVEAGLRSFNRLMPEEINRVVTDHLSTLLFCPSPVAANNLTDEGISKGVNIVGDVMADALQYAVNKEGNKTDVIEKFCLRNKSYLLATIHRAENTDNKERFQNIISALNSLEETIVLPIHPRTKKILNDMNCQPKPHIRIIDPVGYFDMIALENAARMILTDSGGIQKEAYWLSVPCITLRDETEWIETVERGWNILTGADSDRIIEAVHNFKAPTDHPPLYCDGQAAGKLMDILCQKA